MSLICCLSGKKQSGKNTAANYISACYLMKTNQISDFRLTKYGQLECKLKLNGESSWVLIKEGNFNSFDFEGIKHYSFADPLKEFCIDVFGLTHEQCYGTDENKNTKVKVQWGDVPGVEYCPDDCLDQCLTARELLQHFGTNIVRRMFNDAWVNATVSKIRREKPVLAIISDARFPNEINGVMNVGGITIRLLRNVVGKDGHPSETALDDFPQEKYSYAIDNSRHSILEQCEALSPIINELFAKLAGGV